MTTTARNDEQCGGCRGISIGACALDHSVIAPAAGYRISAGTVTVFYAPDVLRIRHPAHALKRTRLYVGDGATIMRPIVRVERRKGVPVGHASIASGCIRRAMHSRGRRCSSLKYSG
jgi:hypothetical protein